jgi:hypothetical protein
MFCLSATHTAMVKITGEEAKRAAHALPAVSQPAQDNTGGTGMGSSLRKTAGRVCGSTVADSPPNRIKMFRLSATHTAMVKITGEEAKRAAHALPAVSNPAQDNTAGTDVGLDLGQVSLFFDLVS